MPGKVLGHLLSRHAPVRLRPTLNPATFGGLWQWWRACRLETWQANRTQMQRLAFYSRQRLHELTRVLKLEYERGDGYLVLLRTAKDLALAKPGLTLLTELSLRFHLVDAAHCRQFEPGLNPDMPLHAGIHLPDDEVGNCRQFAHLLRTEAQRLGAALPLPHHRAAHRARRSARARACVRSSGRVDADGRDPGAADALGTRMRPPRRCRSSRSAKASMRSSSVPQWDRPRCCGLTV